jgi:replicative DNA helicase
MSKTPWKRRKEAYEDALHYLKGRQRGTITSMRTSWEKFNDATIDGLEWQSTTILGGRPGTGKSLIKDQIIRDFFVLNQSTNFGVLNFELEMVSKVSAIRDFSAASGKSYKQLCSAGEKVSDEIIKLCYDHAKLVTKLPIDVVDDPCTVSEIVEIVTAWFEANATTSSKGKIYRPGVVTLDHSILVTRAPYEKDVNEMLYNLGAAITKLKKKFPVIFIVLSQLNRDIDKPERLQEGKAGNYILDSDIFGADALLQHADTVVGYNRPWKRGITVYGPERYIIQNDNVLVAHFLKARNGDVRMSFFEAEYHKMSIREIPTPPQQQKRTYSK